MKNILIFLIGTIGYIGLFILALLKGIWLFNFRDLKDTGHNYRAVCNRFMWQTFKINTY